MLASISSIYVAIERNEQRTCGARNPDAFTQRSIQYDIVLTYLFYRDFAKTNFEAGKIKFGTLHDVLEFLKEKKKLANRNPQVYQQVSTIFDRRLKMGTKGNY